MINPLRRELRLVREESSKWWSSDKNLELRGLFSLWFQVRVLWLLI